jgi:hypothetical protein
MNSSFRSYWSALFSVMRRGEAAILKAKAYATYLLLLPSGAGGHAREPQRLRAVAERHHYHGWLLGCRDRGLRHGRRRIAVTPLEVLGAPSGTIGAALAAAGARRGVEYVLTQRRNGD